MKSMDLAMSVICGLALGFFFIPDVLSILFAMLEKHSHPDDIEAQKESEIQQRYEKMKSKYAREKSPTISEPKKEIETRPYDIPRDIFEEK